MSDPQNQVKDHFQNLLIRLALIEDLADKSSGRAFEGNRQTVLKQIANSTAAARRDIAGLMRSLSMQARVDEGRYETMIHETVAL